MAYGEAMHGHCPELAPEWEQPLVRHVEASQGSVDKAASHGTCAKELLYAFPNFAVVCAILSLVRQLRGLRVHVRYMPPQPVLVHCFLKTARDLDR